MLSILQFVVNKFAGMLLPEYSKIKYPFPVIEAGIEYVPTAVKEVVVAVGKLKLEDMS